MEDNLWQKSHKMSPQEVTGKSEDCRAPQKTQTGSQTRCVIFRGAGKLFHNNRVDSRSTEGPIESIWDEGDKFCLINSRGQGLV